MAVIKCRMCGGDLLIRPGSTLGKCEYCGTKQTVPTADSEKKLSMYARAGQLLAACKFDQAAALYESILAEFPTNEAEAHWGLVLCRYGIEYVDDPSTGRKVPTCHRTSFDSILDDRDYDQACRKADVVARRIYRRDAAELDRIRRGIVQVSSAEASYDIFICYKEKNDADGERTADSVMAQDIYEQLTQRGYRVFFSRITLEDRLGTEYEPYIFSALNSAPLMLVFGTSRDNFNAVWVRNEWTRYLALISAGQKKTLIPCYRDLDPGRDLPKELQQIQSQNMGKVGAVQDLLHGIDRILGKNTTASAPSAAAQQERQPQNLQTPQEAAEASARAGVNLQVQALLRRGELYLEDGSWAEAESCYDRALDLNPEAAEAYLGKLLVWAKASDLKQLQEKTLEELGQKVGKSKGSSRCTVTQQTGGLAACGLYGKILRFGDERLREQVVRVHQGIFCHSASIYREKAQGRYLEAKKFEQDYSRMESDGSADAEEKCRVLEDLRTNSRQAKDNYDLAAALFREIPDFGDAEKLRTDCEEKGEELHQMAVRYDPVIEELSAAVNYEKACGEMSKAAEAGEQLRVIISAGPSENDSSEELYKTAEEQYQKADELFAQYDSYRDTAVRRSQCQEAGQQLGELMKQYREHREEFLEELQRSGDLQEAENLMQEAARSETSFRLRAAVSGAGKRESLHDRCREVVSQYEHAAWAFERLGDYRNARRQARRCRRKMKSVDELYWSWRKKHI